ncbi:MAG: hypothetical protein ACLU9S_02555 [Oscillospiraceae bacterium]
MRRQDGGAFHCSAFLMQKKLRAVTELPQSKQGEQQKWKQSPLIVKVQPQIVEPGKRGKSWVSRFPPRGTTATGHPGRTAMISGQDSNAPYSLMLQPEEQGQAAASR